ncbi:hypothetical protein BS17DRAFT_822614 [Gyrodon lividus]|nr:hypothetical protein BS17DRAFT_822614 [Gyrodon lividus]
MPGPAEEADGVSTPNLKPRPTASATLPKHPVRRRVDRIRQALTSRRDGSKARVQDHSLAHGNSSETSEPAPPWTVTTINRRLVAKIRSPTIVRDSWRLHEVATRRREKPTWIKPSQIFAFETGPLPHEIERGFRIVPMYWHARLKLPSRREGRAAKATFS